MAVIAKFINIITFWKNYTFKKSRRYDTSAISISLPCMYSVTGRVKSRIDIVRTNVAVKLKEAIDS